MERTHLETVVSEFCLSCYFASLKDKTCAVAQFLYLDEVLP